MHLFMTKIVAMFNNTLTKMKKTSIYNCMLPSNPLIMTSCHTITVDNEEVIFVNINKTTHNFKT